MRTTLSHSASYDVSGGQSTRFPFVKMVFRQYASQDHDRARQNHAHKHEVCADGYDFSDPFTPMEPAAFARWMRRVLMPLNPQGD